MVFVVVADLAAIRQLLELEQAVNGGNSVSNNGEICPSCSMPFDKGKKRKLIDTCGHERCYACMFRNELCPLCCYNNERSFNSTNNEHQETLYYLNQQSTPSSTGSPTGTMLQICSNDNNGKSSASKFNKQNIHKNNITCSKFQPL